MQALLFSFNIIFPIFLVMALGYLLKKIGIINDKFIQVGTKITFTVAIPCMLFANIAQASLAEVFDWKLILFAVIAVSASFIILRIIVPRLILEPCAWSSFVQGAFRSNFLIFGFALLNNLGDGSAVAKAAMLAVFIGPLLNILSVIVLAEAKRGSADYNIWRSLYTNPVLISTTLAIIVSLLNIKLPTFLFSSINMLGDLALPLSLLTLGASISFKQQGVNIKRATWASLIKVVLIPALGLPIAYWLGFSGSTMMVCIILLASPAAISCFPMAYQMGADHKLAGMIIAISNTLAIITIFIIIYLLRTLAII